VRLFLDSGIECLILDRRFLRGNGGFFVDALAIRAGKNERRRKTNNKSKMFRKEICSFFELEKERIWLRGE
jgi:hypothetical protein